MDEAWAHLRSVLKSWLLDESLEFDPSSRFDRSTWFCSLLVVESVKSTPFTALLLGLVCAASTGAPLPGADSLILPLRSRSATTNGLAGWETVEKTAHWDPRKTAIVVCDMWNQHWCQGATRRVAEMAPRMNEVIREARKRGVFIIHCPSDTMKFYEGTSQRKLAQSAPVATPRVPLQKWCNLDRSREAPLPIDDSDGGCDDWPQCQGGSPWKRQIADLEILEGDAVTDSAEAYSLMQQRGIDNVIVMGVHLNMCVLGRPFSIRQMVNQGKNVVLMRDLTDTMYNSRQSPFVPHCTGTDLMIEHVERYWCPSTTSVAFLGGEPFRFSENKRPRVVFVVGEHEYHTWETLPEFARNELAWRGIDCEFVNAPVAGGNTFTNYQAIERADLIVLSARRRTPPKPMMDLIRRHLAAGKPLVGIRTASHAFGAKPPDDQHAGWETFDIEVLGGNYQNHYGNGLATTMSAGAGATNHAVMTGVSPDAWKSSSSLYRSRNLSPNTTVLLNGSVEVNGKQEREPVAWLNTARNQRVFYTSLGGPEDFKEPAFRRLLLNGVLWALDRPIPPAPEASTKPQAAATPVPAAERSGPLSPAEAAKRFKVAEDLELDLVLAEPTVAQPVFANFDERGRMWVVQYRQYPSPAGLKMVSRDNVWRAVYDKVPPPPPNHFKGLDEITIHEDTNGDGAFDKHKTFVTGLNIVTSVERGRGGVWVMNPPYLLFYPDADNDDVPDGDPVVHLAGFGLEDTHSVANSLRWGPDGWLYGCQGSTVTGHMLRPGLDKEPGVHTMGQLIWRYHPESRRFEVFSEGGGNAFGCEIDAKGRIFSGHNGGNTRGFHYSQGAYLQKGFEKHGPLSNPYAFGYFPPMPHPDVERFTHNFVIYDGGALPTGYNGKLLGVEPLQGRIVESEILTDQSSFRTRDLSHPVTTDDTWFRPVDIKVGPDGAVYICDWYDAQVNHYRNHEGKIDTATGRIYRLKAKGAKPGRAFDLSKLDSTGLAGLLGHTNKWFRQTALRVIADRRDQSMIPSLTGLMRTNSGQTALEALWALNLAGGLSELLVLDGLNHPDPFVRAWTIRLLGDSNTVSSPVAVRLAGLAAKEGNVEVRGQLASTARRLPIADAIPIIRNLLRHDEDAGDNRVPLLIWWAIESKAESDRNQILELFTERGLWFRPLVQQHLLDRLMRRYAQSGKRQDLLTCARLLELSPGIEQSEKLMAGFEAGFKGRSLVELPDELAAAMSKRGVASGALELRQGLWEPTQRALRIVEDDSVKTSVRLDYLQILGEVRVPSVIPDLLALFEKSTNTPVRRAVLGALQQYDDPVIGTRLVTAYSSLNPELLPTAQSLLTSRATWSRQLVDAVGAGRIQPDLVPQNLVRRIKQHNDPDLVALADKIWATTGSLTTAEMEKQIKRCAEAVQTGIGDPYHGRNLFNNACGQCHVLFGKGGQLGPDLTPHNRADLSGLLLSIVNPSAEIREGYGTYLLDTSDERSLTGFLVSKDNHVVMLRGLDGQVVSVPLKEVATLRTSPVSMMPEGLLDAFNDQQLRDLFAYLRSSQPLVGESVSR